MDKEEFAKRLMATFLDELHEGTGQLIEQLLTLEKAPSGPQRGQLLNSLFRSAHSLKGAARSVGILPIEQMCHRMEDQLANVRDGEGPMSDALVSWLLEAADAIEEAGMRLREEQDLVGSELQKMLAREEVANSADESQSGVPASGPIPAGTARRRETGAAPIESPANSPKAKEPAFPVTPSPELPTPAAVPSAQEAAQDSGIAAAVSSGSRTTPTIRVASEKLDSLLAKSGELLVARRRIEMRVAEVEGLRERVASWRTEWRRVEKPLLNLMSLEKPGTPAQPAVEFPRRVSAMLSSAGPRLKQLERELDLLATRVVSDGRALTSACDALDDEVYNVRMLPFSEACGGLARAVRDLALSVDKEVELLVHGADAEVDRSVLESLKDPLLHLVRNAVDHGLESPDQREAAGKSRQGTVTVSAALRGDRLVVTVADDGRGFDIDRIRAKLQARGVSVPEDDREAARLAFLPGISTAAMVTDVSGRGVGLDVVQDRIEALHGSVDVSFQPGAGTSFSMTVPLTLTTIRCVLVAIGGRTYAVATANVAQLIRFRSDAIRSVAGRAMLLRETPIPVASLSETVDPSPKEAGHSGNRMAAVILTSGDQKVAFVVDEFLTEQEVLVKSLGKRIRRTQHFTGATLLPTGEVALVLNAPGVIRTALGQPARGMLTAEKKEMQPERKRLLVVDDSLTTRTLMKSILEADGYDVVLAVDGEQAWQRLSEETVDLVVTDVEMPRLGGFELTAAVRASARTADLPIVLVTSRGSDEDKKRGIEVGASAYLAKSGFNQENLLSTIAQLL